jgi:hypothetical protein
MKKRNIYGYSHLTAAQILILHRHNKKKFGKKVKHKAAMQLGKLGGLVGGPARAEALSPVQTFTIARHAANQRWGNDCPLACPYCK